MATAQNFAYAYSVTLGTGTSITVDPRGPKTGISVTDTGTDNTAILGDVANDGVTVTGLNNTNSTYYGTGYVNGQYGLILSSALRLFGR
jgi:hypothetical protein